MDFDARLIGTYGIFLIGSQVAYFGMKFNGSASPRNPVWVMVDTFHSIITYGSLAAVGIFIFIEFLWPLGCLLADETSKYLERPKELKPVQMPKMEFTPEQGEEDQKQRQERLEYLRKNHEQVMEKRWIEAQKLEQEELRKKRIIEERRKRTAEEVTRSALDDFL